MDEILREKFLRLIDGNPDLMVIAHELYKYRYCEKLVDFLIKNKITGKQLQLWLNEEFNNSILSMVKFIVMRVNKNKEVEGVFAGRDWFKNKKADI